MTSTEVIEVALAALQVTGHPVFLAQGVEVVVATGDQLVWIRLMADIPNDSIPIKIERLVKRQGEFNNAKSRAEVTSTGGHHLKVALTDLTSNVRELSCAESMQLVRMAEISEMHAHAHQFLQSTRSVPSPNEGRLE